MTDFSKAALFNVITQPSREAGDAVTLEEVDEDIRYFVRALEFNKVCGFEEACLIARELIISETMNDVVDADMNSEKWNGAIAWQMDAIDVCNQIAAEKSDLTIFIGEHGDAATERTHNIPRILEDRASCRLNLLPLSNAEAGLAIEGVEHHGFCEVEVGIVHALHKGDDL